MRQGILFFTVLVSTSLGCSRDVLAPSPAPTAISVASAVARPWHTTVVWSVENGRAEPYRIERRYDSGPWKLIAYQSVEAGQLVLEDYASLPGNSYTYHVRVGEREAAGEVTLWVPE